MKKRTESVSELLKIMGEKAAAAAKKALSEGADMVVVEAKERCPVQTGELQASIHKEAKKQGLKVDVVADAEHNDAEHNGVYYGRLVEFSPRINRPFLYPAMDAKRKAVKDHITEAVREALKKK